MITHDNNLALSQLVLENSIKCIRNLLNWLRNKIVEKHIFPILIFTLRNFLYIPLLILQRHRQRLRPSDRIMKVVEVEHGQALGLMEVHERAHCSVVAQHCNINKVRLSSISYISCETFQN